MNIKNVFKSLAFAMLMPAMLFTTSCGNEDEAIIGGDAAKLSKTIPVTVNVTRQGDKAGTRATYDGTTKKLSFSEGDKLLVDGFTDDVTFAGILEWVSGGTFTGLLDIDGTYSGTDAEMFTEASTGENFIEAILLPNGWETYGVLKIDGEGAFRYFDPDYEKAVAADLATAVEQFSLEQANTYNNGFALAPENAIVNCSYKHSSDVDEGTACKPYISSPDEDFGGEVEIPFGKKNIVNFAIAIPAYNVTWSIKDKSDIISTINLGKKEIVPGHIYNVKNYTPAPALAPTGAIDSKFTINAGGDQVYFSKGNLQATYGGSAWSWAFATNQWDFIGNAAANTSINGDGTISGTGTVDLFGWVGENSAFTGTAIYGITNSTTGNQYGNTKSEALKSDWGTLAISNGGNTANFGWRTLTIDEWDYMLNTRTTTSGVRYAKATVNGIEGLILLPDNWSTDYYSLTSTNTAGAAFTSNEISSTDWTNSLEAHGAVFLPAGGYRNGATVNITSPNLGFYWSSTSSSTSAIQARRLSFTNSGINLNSGTVRTRGHSVRLVYDVE